MYTLEHTKISVRCCTVKRLCFIFLVLVLGGCYAFAQDLGQIGKAKPLTLTGGVAANAVWYNGAANRAPLTYVLTGNVNLNISGVYNIPLTFSYSNLKFNSSNPFSFNRLSINPSYKWVTTHIGDVNMTFSPYTLSGHQFTGFGADLTPKGAFECSLMLGRLLKASEFNTEDPQSQPAFNRIGYGLKLGYKKERYGLKAIVFGAKDDDNSLTTLVPTTFELQAKANVVGSIEANIQPVNKLNFDVVYAQSLITQDTNAEGASSENSPLAALIQTNASTTRVEAYKANVSYQVGQGTVGVGYEYVDPEYRTFGAYFFNNDLEHVTANASQTIFNNKVTIAVNGGIQRDDLNNQKQSQLQRIVSAVNVNYTLNEKLNLSGSYSSFQSFTNIKNQFDRINEVGLNTAVVDTLDFQQISQNATFNTNYTLKSTEINNQSITFNASYQAANNSQDGGAAASGNSQFYNGSSSYTLAFPKRHLTFSGHFNATFNTIGADEILTLGPSLSVSKGFLDNSLRTTAAVSYNSNQNNGITDAQITNLRLNSAYALKKKHNFTLALLSQFRTGVSTAQDITATFGYNYTFDKISPTLKGLKRKTAQEATVTFTYRDSVYGNTQAAIVKQLDVLQNQSHFAFIPQQKRDALTQRREALANLNNGDTFKLEALAFLDDLYSYEDFVQGYDTTVFNILSTLGEDMERLDRTFEKAYVRALAALENHGLHGKTPEARKHAGAAQQKVYNERAAQKAKAQARLVAHRWMLPIIKGYNTLERIAHPDALLKTLMAKEKDAMYLMQDEGKSKEDIQLYLIQQIIDYYCKAALAHTKTEDDIALKYIKKFIK